MSTKAERPFERLTLVQLIGLWEELTINKSYTELTRRYAVILTDARDIATIHDHVAMDVYAEFEHRDMRAPIADWARAGGADNSDQTQETSTS